MPAPPGSLRCLRLVRQPGSVAASASAHPAVTATWVPQLPAALQWDHNAHYHRWLLRQLPPRPDRALDVGCGLGGLARALAERADHVDAIDLSPVMIERAEAVSVGRPNIRWMLGDILDPALPVSPGYDVVTAIASLHHLPLRAALARLAGLVSPGGTLAVVGLYQRESWSDWLLEAAALPANGAVGLALAFGGRAGKHADPHMPVKPPSATLAEIRAAAGGLMAAPRLRRRLFWRYTMVWHHPPTPWPGPLTRVT